MSSDKFGLRMRNEEILRTFTQKEIGNDWNDILNAMGGFKEVISKIISHRKTSMQQLQCIFTTLSAIKLKKNKKNDESKESNDHDIDDEHKEDKEDKEEEENKKTELIDLPEDILSYSFTFLSHPTLLTLEYVSKFILYIARKPSSCYYMDYLFMTHYVDISSLNKSFYYRYSNITKFELMVFAEEDYTKEPSYGLFKDLTIYRSSCNVLTASMNHIKHLSVSMAPISTTYYDYFNDVQQQHFPKQDLPNFQQEIENIHLDNLKTLKFEGIDKFYCIDQFIHVLQINNNKLSKLIINECELCMDDMMEIYKLKCDCIEFMDCTFNEDIYDDDDMKEIQYINMDKINITLTPEGDIDDIDDIVSILYIFRKRLNWLQLSYDSFSVNDADENDKDENEDKDEDEDEDIDLDSVKLDILSKMDLYSINVIKDVMKILKIIKAPNLKELNIWISPKLNKVELQSMIEQNKELKGVDIMIYCY